jgi:hypothetical protein
MGNGCSGFSGFNGCHGGEPDFLDLEFTQGTTYVLDCQYFLGAAPLDLSTATIYMTGKADYGVPDASALFQISTTSGDIAITDAAQGKFVVTIPPSATAGLNGLQLRMVYNVMIDLSPNRYPVVMGRIDLLRSSTLT